MLGNHLGACTAHVFGCAGFLAFMWIVPRGEGVDEGKLHCPKNWFNSTSLTLAHDKVRYLGTFKEVPKKGCLIRVVA